MMGIRDFESASSALSSGGVTFGRFNASVVSFNANKRTLSAVMLHSYCILHVFTVYTSLSEATKSLC